jgi:AcrR family transcriptional regulator
VAAKRRGSATGEGVEVARATGRNNASNGNAAGPRRSALVQARSRNTRHQLVRTALALWDERGFERGIDETTVDEIAKAAGVTKGTFYFHFAHKEDILLEIGWAAAEAMMKEAQGAMQRERPAAAVIDAVLSSLARRVSRAPRPAVIRAAAEFSRRTHDRPTRAAGAIRFGDSFGAVVRYAAERGDLPPSVDVDDLANLLEAATMDSILRWAATRDGASTLRRKLQVRAELILTGASVVYAWRLPGDVSARAR